jgi:hypothetical protein
VVIVMIFVRAQRLIVTGTMTSMKHDYGIVIAICRTLEHERRQTEFLIDRREVHQRHS